ncbi:MAG: glycosyltransferase [Mycobacteriaceae bacterium]|nr:glycosyltransferase [Mycobacteriaceae bacterium]MBV9638454.1 glycosyltransferase [Mycobacteriaceae bacterium]
MRIAMISEHASPLAALGGVDAGGQNVHVAELSAAMARRGHQVLVYTRRDDAGLPERVRTAAGYTVVHVPAGPATNLGKDDLLEHMGPFGEFLAEQWITERPDIAHAHFWMSGVATRFAARRRNIPMVQTFHALGVVKRRHQGVQDTSPAARAHLEEVLARDTDWVAATSTDEVFELVRLGRPRSRTSVIPCGVDLKRFTPDGPRAQRSARRRVVAVGRLVPRKGFDILVRAIVAVPGTELLIVGGPDVGGLGFDPEAVRLSTLAAELGVADRVRLTGSVSRPEMPALLRSADVVACTPWYEPFGIVPVEAMACGVPVLAAAVGGMLDTVVDGGTGVLVPPRDPGACAEALNAMLADPARLAEWGRAGRARAESRYSWDRIAADTLKVYQRMAPASQPVTASRQSG